MVKTSMGRRKSSIIHCLSPNHEPQVTQPSQRGSVTPGRKHQELPLLLRTKPMKDLPEPLHSLSILLVSLISSSPLQLFEV